ncbi:RfeD protein [Apiospora arundinis]
MPPRSSLTSSFSIADSTNEVVCPLRNQDGSSCRKRCLGEKRFRSMQEHIRRAHPEHYISKLPATEESFNLMVNTPPQDRSQLQQNQSVGASSQQQRTPGSAPGTAEQIRGYPLDPRINYAHDDPNAPPRHRGVRKTTAMVFCQLRMQRPL